MFHDVVSRYLTMVSKHEMRISNVTISFVFSFQCTVQPEHSREKSKNSAHPVPKASIKIAIAKDPVYGVHLARTLEKKVPRASMIVYPFVDTVHTLLRVWYPVWNVLGTATQESHQWVATKTVRPVQQEPLPISQLHLVEIDAEPNVLLACTLIQDWLLVPSVPKTSSNLSTELPLASSVRPTCIRMVQARLDEKSANLCSAPTVYANTVVFACPWGMVFSVSAQLASLEDGVKSISTNVPPNPVTMELLV